MDRYVCIHGHFYQPPRENPWLGEIEVQDSAYPYHDWNERINAECYAPNTASRIVGGDGDILDIVNNYASISFNFGPTLLSWMEAHDPEIYRAVIEADKRSQDRFSGHGSAMAQAHNHLIMPLANARDKHTQVHWGIEDFRHRFHRDPEGMWLPETAVDLETLDIMASLGIRFTVLAPRQARRVRDELQATGWHSVEGGSIDPTRAYRCILPSGRTISLFFYDGPISQGIAFEGLLKTGEGFANRLLGAFNDGRNWDQLVNIATDGETYGHHHRFGDMALAYALHYMESHGHARITNYGEYLEAHPADHVVEIFENSSWSCVHGVERWRSDCGCCSGMHSGWHQKWRAPLREALDSLRDRTIPLFESEGPKYLKDPWQARNDYIHVVNDRSIDNVAAFLEEHCTHPLDETEKQTALKLLGMERCTMLMYTSCGWFFDEISGIETVQVMAYASRLIQLARDIDPGLSLEEPFIEALSKAPSNVLGNGAEVYRMYVLPSRVDILRVAAHYVISSLFVNYPEEKTHHIYSYAVTDEVREPLVAGTRRLSMGHLELRSNLTWEQARVTFAAFAFGDINVTAGLRHFIAEEVYQTTRDEIAEVFEKGDIPGVIRALDVNFPQPYNYSLWHLFRDQQRKVINEILKPKYDQIDDLYRGIYDGNYAVMDFLRSLGNPIPKPLFSAADAILDLGLSSVFGPDFKIERLNALIGDAKKWDIAIDRDGLGLAAVSWLDGQVRQVFERPEEPESTRIMEVAAEALRTLGTIPLELHPWRAQNMYFRLRKDVLPGMEVRAGMDDESARQWVTAFRDLAALLHIDV